MTNEGGKTCPVCTEEMDLTDLQLKPCKCGYEVCVWCWNHIMDMAEKDGTEGRCPACRNKYDKAKIVSMSASVEIYSDRKAKPQKLKSKTYDARKHLSNDRVVQRHLVYTMGLPANLADEEVLQRKEYFGQYGKVLKASLTRTSGGAIQYATNNTCSVYITFSKEEEAVRCIQSVHGYILQGQPLRACFGTTKYCHAWLRNMPCSNPDCVYLHEVGNPDDSFTKEEIVSAYTRSRVQQINGANNNLERCSGNLLPPPVDEPCISGSASSKPISRSPTDNPQSQLKSSPPNSSSGRSISLPAAASWGLRVSNGHPPTPTTLVSSNGPSKQKHEDSNGSVGFPSLISSTTSTSMLHTDVGKKAWVTKEGRTSHSSKDLGSFEYSKHFSVADGQKIMPDSTGEVLQDIVPADVISMDLHSLASSGDDSIQKLPNVACSVETDPQSSISYSDENVSTAANGRVPRVFSGLSSGSVDNYLSNEHSDDIDTNSTVSNQLLRSFGNHGLQQSNPEQARGCLTSLPPRKSSNWGPESHTQALRDTGNAREDDLLASGEQNSTFSEVCHPLHLPNRSSSLSMSTSSNGHSWPYDHACGTSDPVRDPRSVHTKADELGLPFKSSDSVLSNGYRENNVSTSAGLEKIFEHSNLFSSVEKGKYPGSLNSSNPVDFEKNTSVDMGESNIISNILSMDFDEWDESLASPQNIAKLLNETDKQLGGLKISSRKEQKSNQSRFSFARQVDFADQGTDNDRSYNIGNMMGTNSTSQVFQDNRDSNSAELRSGLSCNFLEESDTVYGSNSNIPYNRYSVPRTPVSAPPGFSVPSKIPPPGFNVQERMDKAFGTSPVGVNHFLGSSALQRNQYHLQPTTELARMEDVELIDPAILAVGTGRPANGINDFSSDFRSNPLLHLSSENDPRIQLLRQQYLPQQQNLRYSDHIGDRYSPLTDAYNTTSSRFLDQSVYAQQSLQPRAERFSHGWNSWNETQSGNDLGGVDYFKNERYGYNQYYPDYDNRNNRMPSSNDIYNKAFGM